MAREKSGSSSSVRQRRPATHRRAAHPAAVQQRAAGEHLDVAGLVGGLHGQQLQDLAEVRMHAGQQPGRDDERGLLVLDQVGHHLDDGAPRRPAVGGPPASQSTAVAGSHCAAAAWAYSRGARSAHTTSRSARSNGPAGPPASTSAPRAARPQWAGGCRTTPSGAGTARAFAPGPALLVGPAPDQVVPAAPRRVRSRGPSARHHARRCTPQRGVGARDPHRPPGRHRPQRAADQEVPALVDAQAAEIQRGCVTACSRRRSPRRPRRRSRPRRRRGPAARNPLVRPSCQTLRPSRSSSGRTSGSA